MKEDNSKFSKWWSAGLVILFLARLVLGMTMISNTDISMMPDSPGYLEVATYWDENGLFQSSGTDADLMRTPGYPLLLWLIMQTPLDPATGIVLIQLLMGGLIAVLIFRITHRFSSYRAAGVGVVFALLSPNLFLWSLTILTDVSFTFFLLFSVYLLLRFTDHPSPATAFWSGLVLGAATLIRPISILLIPAWALVVLTTKQLHPSWISRLKLALMTLLGALLLVMPWVARNAIVWDQATLSPISTWNLGQYQAAGALARAEGISIEEARTRFTLNRPPIAGDRARYLKIIFNHLEDYLIIHLQGTKLILTEANQPLFNHFIDERYRGSGVFSELVRLRFSEAWSRVQALRGNERQFQLFLLNSTAQFGLAFIYIFTFLGLLTIIRSHNPQARTLMVIILVMVPLLILTPGPVGNDRFRLPIEPYLALLAALGFVQCVNWGICILRPREKEPAGEAHPPADS